MARRIIPYIILFLFCFPQHGEAQRWKLRRYEGIFGVGFINYFGDIGGAATTENWWGLKDLSIKDTRPSFYLGARYKIRPEMAVRLNLMYGFITGDDSGSKNSDRGYSFSSTVFEPSVQYEYSLLTEEQRRRSSALYNRRGMMNNYSQISLYLYAGIGGVFYNPRVNDAMKTSSYYNPDPPRMGLVFPAGLGVKYVISQSWSVGADFGIHLALVDYLDGYSSPFSKRNDLYYFGHVHGIYRIKTSKEGYPILFRRGRRLY
jgi:OOP family OmpA-OmpF porin